MPARRRRGASEYGNDLVIGALTTLLGHQNQQSSETTSQYYNEKPTFEKVEEELQKQRAPPPQITMTARDRTNELANAIRSIQSRTVARAAVSRTPRQARQIQSYSEFMMIAKNIGKNIASTYTKLEKLALRKSIWPFSHSLTICIVFINIVIILLLLCNSNFFPIVERQIYISLGYVVLSYI